MGMCGVQKEDEGRGEGKKGYMRSGDEQLG